MKNITAYIANNVNENYHNSLSITDYPENVKYFKDNKKYVEFIHTLLQGFYKAGLPYNEPTVSSPSSPLQYKDTSTYNQFMPKFDMYLTLGNRGNIQEFKQFLSTHDYVADVDIHPAFGQMALIGIKFDDKHHNIANKAAAYFVFDSFYTGRIQGKNSAPLNRLTDANIDILIGMLEDIKKAK